GKNIKLLNGKPLIQYTIEVARKLFSDQQIIVSTDDQTIIDVVEQLGLKVPFKRPPELATDKAGTYEVLLHAMKYAEQNGIPFDKVLLLQPTSPFRTQTNLEEAYLLYNEELDMVVSVKETKSNPYYVLFEENEKGYLVKSKPSSFIRRQDCPKVWEYNGAIYIMNKTQLQLNPPVMFTKIKKYVMNEFESHDIDTPLDWLIAEHLLNETKA
ncbi:MAG: cytidylyltransferase domain-containing protein, partial [Bacteroidota bacterium]